MLRNFKLETYSPITMPSVINEKDVYSMFSGLLTLIKELAHSEAKKSQIHKDKSYEQLLKMYTNAVHQMNKYKSLYLSTLKENKELKKEA